MEQNEDWHTDAKLFRSLPGGDAIVDWFGYVPSFHDAELLELKIAPEAVVIRLHVFRMTNETDPDGYFLRDRHASVTLRLEDVTALRLTGSSASILLELRIRQVEGIPGASNAWRTCYGPEQGDYEVELYATYGLEGSVFAKRIEMKFEPLLQA